VAKHVIDAVPLSINVLFNNWLVNYIVAVAGLILFYKENIIF
jgi:hypothetical protein